MPRPHPFSSPRAFAEAVGYESRLRTALLRMERRLARAGRRGEPVVVGPWWSEIGFELLYWIPMLRRLTQDHGVDPEQVTAISRGGPRLWYDGIASDYVDLLEIFSVDEFRDAQERRIVSTGEQKQFVVTADDREAWRRVAPPGAALVHPLVMYGRLRYFWAADEGIAEVERLCDHRRLPVPDAPELELPERFVAAKLYFSDCFPDVPANRRFAADVLAGLAERTDVVLLSTGLALDDHAETELVDHPRVHGVADALRPHDNLQLQTEIIGSSRGLVATYGGPSYLAPFLGLPSTSVFSNDDHNPSHLEAARSAAHAVAAPEPVVVDTRSDGALAAVLDAASAGVALR